MLYYPEGAQTLAVRTRVARAYDQSTNPDVTAGFQTLVEHNFSVGGTAPVAKFFGFASSQLRFLVQSSEAQGQCCTSVLTDLGRPMLLITICRAYTRVLDSEQTVSVPA